MENLNIEFRMKDKKTDVWTDRKPSVNEIVRIILICAKMIENLDKGMDVWREKDKGDE